MSALNRDFDPITSDGQTEIQNIPVSSPYAFFAAGDFDNGLLSIEVSPDNGVNWFTVNELTKSGRLIQWLSSGEKLRLTLEGSTNPSITAGIRQ